MALMKLAAGLAVGYVLGTRAGREQYEQIAAGVRELSNRPSVQQAKEKTTRAVRSSTSAKGRHATNDESSGDEPRTAGTSRPAPGTPLAP